MIFAENGNGKSTISDALVCLLTDGFGSLDDKSSVDQQFIKSLGTGHRETKITLNADSGSYSASISGTTINFQKSPSTGQPALRFLRRSQIVNMVNTKPSERYSSLKYYIDVSGIFASEEELRKLNRETEQNLNSAVSVLTNAKETLEEAWTKEGKPDEDFLIWAKLQSEVDLSKDKRALETLNVLMDQWKAIGTKHGEIVLLNESLKATLKAFHDAEKEVVKLQKESKKNAAILLELLQKARTYLTAQTEIKSCPVCENSIDREKVVKSLGEQIASMDVLKKAAENLEVKRKNHEKYIGFRSRAVVSISTLIARYKESINNYSLKVPEILPFVKGVGIDPKSNYDCYLQNITPLQTLYSRIEDSQKSKAKAVEQHNFISTQYKAIVSNSEKMENLAKLSIAASKTLTIVESARKEFFDNELLSISGDVEQMYQKLHPSEGLGGIKLFLNPKFKTSLELQADFHSETGITPQSVYSESHLDTLGICIFLALAKKYSDGDTILVLDDVVMSVDEKHLDRFIDLLHDESSHFGQIIITTHYRPWRDRYRNNRAPAGAVHFLELRNWSKENGIRVFNSKLILDELKQLLENEENFHRENISGSSGRILENLLDYLTIKFASRLPRKPKGDYQLHELLTGLSKELLKVFKVEHFSKDAFGKFTVNHKSVELSSIVERLKQLKAIRNQVGAHFSFDGSMVGDGDVTEFGKVTIEFAELLICPESGGLPDKNSSGSYWETKTGSIRLFPLVDPK